VSAHADLREAFQTEIDHHLVAVSPHTRAVLHELVEHEWFPGSSDPGALATLLAVVRTVRPRRVLARHPGRLLDASGWRNAVTRNLGACATATNPSA
jgi:hypothetical protein